MLAPVKALRNPEVTLSPDELKKIFDPQVFLSRVDYVFKKLEALQFDTERS